MASFAAHSMTITALFALKKKRTLQFDRGTRLNELRLHRSAAPGLHVRGPGSFDSCEGQHPDCQVGEYDDDNSDRTPAVMLFALVREKRQSNQEDCCNKRNNKEQN